MGFGFLNLSFAKSLREIRKSRGVRSPHALSSLMKFKYSSAEILRRETGKRRLDVEYLKDFSHAVGLSQAEADVLLTKAKIHLYRGQSDDIKIEKEYGRLFWSSRSIFGYSADVIPSLLQSSEYINSILSLIGGGKTPAVTPQARLRWAKEKRELAEDIKIVCNENALYMPIGSSLVMIKQISSIQSFEDDHHFQFRVLPNHIYLQVPSFDSFFIIDSIYCYTESRIGSLTSEDPAVVAKLAKDFETIWASSVMGLKRDRILQKALKFHESQAEANPAQVAEE
jgi:hypothetical protein